MTLRQKVVKSLKGLCIGLAINQIAGGILPSSLTLYPSKIEIDDYQLVRFHSLSPTANAIEYLNAANSLVRSNSCKDCNCKDYALATFTTYSQLVEENGRDDLEDRIRLVNGVPSVSGKDAHLWLEVEQDGVFTPYESNNYSRNRSIINDGIDKEGWIMARSFNGTRIFHPTLESFFYPGGLVRMLYLSQTVARSQD